MKKISMIVALLSCIGLVSNAAWADKKTEKTKEEQMQAYMKLISPSDAHKRLNKFIGTWNYTGTFWIDASGKNAQNMSGVTTNAWVMDGRFMQQNAKGDAVEGQPAFMGLGLTGYDNVRKEYVSTWIDNMSTSMMNATSSFDKKTKSFKEVGTYSCPITGGKKDFRAVWKIKNKNAYKYTWYTTDPATGKEYKSMEISYKRAK